MDVHLPIHLAHWLASLWTRKVKEKDLESIIADILKESCIINPIHNQKIDLLREKRAGTSHSGLLMKLEEKFNLVEYDKMTGPAFVTHIFLEEANSTMQKIATDILANKPGGDINALRAHVKQTVASLWYMHGSSRTAKSARDTRWCPNCKSSSHSLKQCWG